MSNISYIKTKEEIGIIIANKIKYIRKDKHITQKDLSLMSGVSYGSLKRFEQTGEISFLSLIEIARCLNQLESIYNLFEYEKVYKSIEEVIDSWKK